MRAAFQWVGWEMLSACVFHPEVGGEDNEIDWYFDLQQCAHMLPRYLLVCIVLACLCGVSYGKGKKNHTSDSGGPQAIIEVSPMSITVDAGKDVQESYNITGATTATLDGIRIKPEDLRAGMLAMLTLAPNGEDVLSVAAQNAPRSVKAPKKPTDNVNLNVGLVK